MKRLLVDITVTVAVDVPDNFPVVNEKVAEILLWKANDYTDGRRPFPTELVHDGVVRTVSQGIEESAFQHFCGVEPYTRNRNIEQRNEAIIESTLGTRCHVLEGGDFKIAVRDEA